MQHKLFKKLKFNNMVQTANDNQHQASMELPNEINFSDYCKEQLVKPLCQDSVWQYSEPKKKATNASRYLSGEWLNQVNDLSWEFINTEPVAPEFFRFGQRKLPQELRNNKFSFTANLDLHTCTRSTALNQIETLLNNSQPGSCFKIIHGNGNHSEFNQPILKILVRKYLAANPQVLAYSYGASSQGGDGVTLVKLTSVKS